MGIKIYEVGTFTKKEKEIFDSIGASLIKEFQKSAEDIILMGSVSTRGSCELDALIFKRNAIIIVEFKNYGGQITTSINGDWLADSTVIKGGAGGKNPLQQINKNKSSLSNDLKLFYPKSTSGWYYSAACVLFQQPIKFEKHGGDNLGWLKIIEEKDFLSFVKKEDCSNRISFTKEEFDQIPLYFEVEKRIVKIEEDKNRKILSPLEYIVDDLRDYSKIKQILKENTFVGIDFGTSTTVVSYVLFDEDSQVLKTETLNFEYNDVVTGKKQESYLIPSVVYYDKHNDVISIGNDGKQRRGKAIQNENYWASFKIQLGQDLGNIFNKSQLKGKNGHPSIKNNKEATKVFLLQIVKLVNEHIKKNNLPTDIYYAVSVPASFEVNQRKDLIDILTSLSIKFSKDLFIDEPNAAFLSFLQTSPGVYDKNFTTHTLVFDFGAGTCDISILELGFSSDGFYTKNLSISEFKEFGGDNIDRKLAKEVMFPALCSQTAIDLESVSDMEYDVYFKDVMKPFAENLKIALSNQLRRKPTLKNTETVVMSGEQVEIILESDKRQIVSNSPSVSYSEFHDIMKTYVCEFDGTDKENIFYLINSALNKAGLQATEIDSILLVGGSCYNPYIVDALRGKFETANIIVPKDLQSHVSRGAALHSFFGAGLGKNPLIPIVNETIFIQLADGQLIPLVHAGDTIPTKNKNVTGKLMVQNEKQTMIELPVFVGEGKRLIQNLQITNKKGFNTDDTIKITGEIDENKVLLISVEVNEKPFRVEQIQPFSNEVLTSYQTKVKMLLRQINNLISDEGECAKGLEVLVNDLAKLHEKVGNFREAFNVKMRFSATEFTSIAYYATLAGLEQFGKEYTELAFANNNTGVTAYNLAIQYDEGSPEYEKYMKIASELGDQSAWFCYGRLLDGQNNPLGAKLVENAYSHFYDQFSNCERELALWEYYNLIDIANYLNLNNQAIEFEKAKNKEYRPSDAFDVITPVNQLVEKRPIK